MPTAKLSVSDAATELLLTADDDGAKKDVGRALAVHMLAVPCGVNCWAT